MSEGVPLHERSMPCTAGDQGEYSNDHLLICDWSPSKRACWLLECETDLQNFRMCGSCEQEVESLESPAILAIFQKPG